MANNFLKEDKLSREVKYLNKDFQSFRSDLLNYANIHFSDKIQDFSEAGLGGLFLDMSSYVGDVMSYYLDHQYNELSLETAIEPLNIERLIRDTGVKITGASPSYSQITFYITVPSIQKNGVYDCDSVYLPIVKSGTILRSTTGVEFTLLEDINMAEKDTSGQLVASKTVASIDSNSNPTTYYVYRDGIATSSKVYEQKFTLTNTFVPFREIELNNPDVVEIISVIDSENNEYFEVETLSEDTTFKRYTNIDDDKSLVADTLAIKLCPRRYEKVTSTRTAKTVIRFGGGRSDTYENDIIPNPSDHALPLFGERKTFTKKPVNPNLFLESGTLGVAPQGTTITVRYRAGGGLSHNVSSGEINSLKTIISEFNESGEIQNIISAKSSIQCFNELPAKGGTDRPTLDDYRFIALSSRGSQGRIVTKQDLLARVYTMPSKFGRVFRAGIVRNQGNINSASLSIITRNKGGFLTIASDTLKSNLKKYLNEFRLLTDSYDIVDSLVANFGIEIEIKLDNRYNKDATKNNVFEVLKQYFKIENFQIEQPISRSEVHSLIYNLDGVEEVIGGVVFVEKSGIIEGLTYNNYSYSLLEREKNFQIFPPLGGIFELKYPESDIKISIRE